MKTDAFDFDLPEELIAAYPAQKRGEDRLLVMDRQSGELEHRDFRQLSEYLQPGDLLVFNDVKVRKARLKARKESGGRVEVLLLSTRDGTDREWNCLLGSSRPVREESRLLFADALEARVVQRLSDGHFHLSFSRPLDEACLERIGEIPLPPYILKKRPVDSSLDEERYQTVFAREGSAVAAPTAGLHFTDTLLSRLTEKGVETSGLTLDVGWGTFAPVKSEEIEAHKMHQEIFRIPEETATAIGRARTDKRRVIAVGTTVVRSLEAAAQKNSGTIEAGEYATELFIQPGYAFSSVDAILTNFHTPRSTLLMMISAFAGYDAVMAAYKEAVRERYRFFSYGDAMLII